MSTPLSPTYYGYIGSTKDALLVIQAALNLHLEAVPRRPHDRERSSLIQSGNCFVFSEEKSGIKRWTDGFAWSPSRILGRFLVYRELDRSALGDPEETRKAKRKKVSVSSTSGSLLSYNQASPKRRSASSVSGPGGSLLSYNQAPSEQHETGIHDESGRLLMGSLVASYAFKENGLIKKTLSLTITHRSLGSSSSTEVYHLISYYKADDVISGKLVRPQDSSLAASTTIMDDLWNAVKESNLGSKLPIEDEAHYFIDGKFPQASGMGVRKKLSPPPPPPSLLYYGNSYPQQQLSSFGHFDEYPQQPFQSQLYPSKPQQPQFPSLLLLLVLPTQLLPIQLQQPFLELYSLGPKRKLVYSPISKPKSPEPQPNIVSVPPLSVAGQPSWYTYGSSQPLLPPQGFPLLSNALYFLQSSSLPSLSQHSVEGYSSTPSITQQLLPHLFQTLSVSNGSADSYSYHPQQPSQQQQQQQQQQQPSQPQPQQTASFYPSGRSSFGFAPSMQSFSLYPTSKNRGFLDSGPPTGSGGLNPPNPAPFPTEAPNTTVKMASPTSTGVGAASATPLAAGYFNHL